MALTDIVFYEVVAEANRGDTGVVADSVTDTSRLFAFTIVCQFILKVFHY